MWLFVTRSTTCLLTVVVLLVLKLMVRVSAVRDYAYFNLTSNITVPHFEWDLRSTKEITFRTCSITGNLLTMKGFFNASSTSSTAAVPSQELLLLLSNSSAVLEWSIDGHSGSVTVGQHLNISQWYTIRLKYLLGALELSLSQALVQLDSKVLANNTVNKFLFDVRLSGTLTVGDKFTGCIFQGPGVIFSQAGLQAHDIVWDSCPMSQECSDGEYSKTKIPAVPLLQHVPADIFGPNPQCPLLNSNSEDFNSNWLALAVFLGYTGTNCTEDVNECLNSTACGSYSCFNYPGGFSCDCPPGYDGTPCFVVNECLSQPCQHGSTCTPEEGNGFHCTCVEDYTGALCEEDMKDCASFPCHNLGTQCVDLLNSYRCECASGFSGTNCHDIDECSLNFCQNNVSCTNTVGNYTCVCLPGYTGLNCTEDNNASFPCAPGTDLNGTTCVSSIDHHCLSTPCQHEGTCVPGIKTYSCSCLPGFHGSNCENDILECSLSPCPHNSLCLEYSNQSLYDKGNPKFINFSYEKAAGYLCVCVPGFEGDNCSEEINECQRYSPCKNGGTCIDKIGDYECQCPALTHNFYGGKNCTVFLSGCDGHQCHNGDCIPKLVSGIDSYNCVCAAGYSGRLCDKPTDISFTNAGNNSQYIMREMNSSQFDLSFYFRTTLSNAVLILCRLTEEAYISVELRNGRIVLNYIADSDRQIWQVPTQAQVNDSEYHQLRLVLTHNITLELPLDRCTSRDNTLQQTCKLVYPYFFQLRSVTWLYIGSIQMSGLSSESFPQDYAGCMKDIYLNRELYYPGQQIGDYFGVNPGCSRTDWCAMDPCNRSGLCEDLWDSFTCHCYRPNYGVVCEKEYQSATFGLEPGSFASYSISPFTSGKDDCVFSLFIITRQDSAFMTYFGNNEMSNAHHHTYVALYTKNGRVCGDFYKCGYNKSFTSDKSIDDGQKHFLLVSVKGQIVTVTLDLQVIHQDVNVSASTTVCQTDYAFYITKVTLGRFIKFNTRRRRNANSLMDNWTKESSEFKRLKRETSLLDEYSIMPNFQGVLQDVQVNNAHLSFADPNLTNVTLGHHSTQQLCQESPCEHGGNCTDIFYNDFTCACIQGYTGKNCSELDFCSYDTCPAESICQNLQDGYECVSTAAFIEDDAMISYNISGVTPEPVLTFDFRTRGLFGLIFILRKDDYYFKVRVAKGQLEVNYKLSDAFSESVGTLQGKRIDDGQWYSVRFEIINGTWLKLLVYQEESNILDQTKLTPFNGTHINVTEMMTYGDIILGNTREIAYSVHWEAPFKGCLHQARLGALLMPFFNDSTFLNNTVMNKLTAHVSGKIVHHCTGANACADHKCMNGGQCRDVWNAYTCQCPLGFEGRFCKENPDNCLGQPCQNRGHCVDGHADYICVCPKGYTGNECQTDLDLCNGTTNASMCLNGNLCVDRDYDYVCNCTEYTGWFCNVTVHQNCSHINLCQNGGTCTNINLTTGNDSAVSSFNCTCQSGYEGPLCEKVISYCSMNGIVCANYSLCVNQPQYQNYTCLCNSSGGQHCDVPVDLCVNSSLCQHGICGNGTCSCTSPGWTGSHCDMQLNECKTANTCHHNGTCTDLEGTFNCTCTLGYKGQWCQIPDCTGLCENGATCATNSTHWWCECPEFVQGEVCSLTEPCFHQLCNSSNTDSCVQSLEHNNYTCHCKSGWQGMNCSEDINECNVTDSNLSHKCVNGNCSNTAGSYTCTCQPGYTGHFCEEDIDECQSMPCINNGICTQEVNNYTCNCNDTGYEGPTCTVNINECTRNESICNAGMCNDTEGNFSCTCGPMYLGNVCQFENPCFNFSCLNNGVCVANKTIGEVYITLCQCVDGYEGTLCEKNPKADKSSSEDLGVIIGPIVGGVVFIIIVIVIIAFVMTARSKRATRGAYSPSQQETSGSRVELGNVLKKPPEERLI